MRAAWQGSAPTRSSLRRVPSSAAHAPSAPHSPARAHADAARATGSEASRSHHRSASNDSRSPIAHRSTQLRERRPLGGYSSVLPHIGSIRECERNFGTPHADSSPVAPAKVPANLHLLSACAARTTGGYSSRAHPVPEIAGQPPPEPQIPAVQMTAQIAWRPPGSRGANTLISSCFIRRETRSGSPSPQRSSATSSSERAVSEPRMS